MYQQQSKINKDTKVGNNNYNNKNKIHKLIIEKIMMSSRSMIINKIKSKKIMNFYKKLKNLHEKALKLQ